VRRRRVAAQAIAKDTLEALKSMQGLGSFYILDNDFFVGAGSSVKQKLSGTYAKQALAMLLERGTEELTTAEFKAMVCRPLKLLELWEAAMVRRFGSVASASAAFARVLAMGRTWGGLQKIVAAKTQLHAEITEFIAIFTEMSRCLAGGHGPPARIPTAAEQAESGKVVENSPPKPIHASDDGDLVEETLGVESAAPDTDAQESRRLVEAKLNEDREGLRFSRDMKQLVDGIRDSVHGDQRCTVIIEAPTSLHAVTAKYIDGAKEVVSVCSATSKCRVLVLMRASYEAFGRVTGKLKSAFPKWELYLVPMFPTSRSMQNARGQNGRSSFVMVAVPPG
jgi:hypothetical protein